MYIFAHVFAGALLGLILWHLPNDRRAIHYLYCRFHPP